ncbi:MAG: hypothetical protein MUC59_19610 [Saprospiraceae bacterium]|nr:hypothetical protein [Saprospiraceae bacterium]
MKKMSIPTSFLLGMVVLSLSCYIYLHQAATSIEAPIANAKTIEIEEEKESLIMLFDLAFVKQVLNITKIILPKD